MPPKHKDDNVGCAGLTWAFLAGRLPSAAYLALYLCVLIPTIDASAPRACVGVLANSGFLAYVISAFLLVSVVGGWALCGEECQTVPAVFNISSILILVSAAAMITDFSRPEETAATNAKAANTALAAAKPAKPSVSAPPQAT